MQSSTAGFSFSTANMKPLLFVHECELLPSVFSFNGYLWNGQPRLVENLTINPELPTANACAVALHQRLGTCSDGTLPRDANYGRNSLVENEIVKLQTSDKESVMACLKDTQCIHLGLLFLNIPFFFLLFFSSIALSSQCRERSK